MIRLQLLKLRHLAQSTRTVHLSSPFYDGTLTRRAQAAKLDGDSEQWRDMKETKPPPVPEFPNLYMPHIHDEERARKERLSRGIDADDETLGVTKFGDMQKLPEGVKLKQITFMQKYLYWTCYTPLQKKYPTWRDMPDYLPIMDRKGIRQYKRDNPEKWAEKMAYTKANQLQFGGRIGMFCQIATWFAIAIGLFVAYGQLAKVTGEKPDGRLKHVFGIVWDTFSYTDYSSGYDMIRAKSVHDTAMQKISNPEERAALQRCFEMEQETHPYRIKMGEASRKCKEFYPNWDPTNLLPESAKQQPGFEEFHAKMQKDLETVPTHADYFTNKRLDDMQDMMAKINAENNK